MRLLILLALAALDTAFCTHYQLIGHEWVVYAKACLHRPHTVVRYLARYTGKIAISESRLMGIDAHSVHFAYRDYRDNQCKQMRLSGKEFLRRFLQHVLPHGLMRIRHFGWLANACRAKKLVQVRAAIATAQKQPAEPQEPVPEPPSGFEGIACPGCQTGRMRVCYTLAPKRLEYG